MAISKTVLKLDVSPDFIELTNHLIDQIKTKGITFENRNFLLAKVPVKEKAESIIVISNDSKRVESYKSGVGRVIAAPRILDIEQDADAKVGDYVVYTHESKYAINEPVVNFMFDLDMKFEEGMEPVICIRDVDVLAVIKPEALEKKA